MPYSLAAVASASSGAVALCASAAAESFAVVDQVVAGSVVERQLDLVVFEVGPAVLAEHSALGQHSAHWDSPSSTAAAFGLVADLEQLVDLEEPADRLGCFAETAAVA